MARYFRRSYRRYSRSGARGRYRRSRYSFGRRTASKYRNTRSARQMTQNSLYQIVTTNTHLLTIAKKGTSPNFKYYGTQGVDLSGALIANNMYKNLTNVFDQVRVERINIKITPLANTFTAGNTMQFSLFTAVDRNGFATVGEVTMDLLRSYQSYKSTIYGSSSSNKIPNHYVSIDYNTLVEKSAYYTSKLKPPCGFIALGVEAPIEDAMDKTVSLSVEITYDVRMRGVRLDSSDITNSVSSIN